MNPATLGEESLRRYGEYPALVFEDRELTNVDQQRAANRLAHALGRLGVGPGDRVVVMLPNYAHPGVAEAAVVGMPDPLMGEEGCAFVVLRAGATATPEALIAFCQERLATFKCPKQVRFVEALPKSPIGKILRKQLRTLVT